MLLGERFPNLPLTSLEGETVQMHSVLRNKWTVVVTLNAHHPVSSTELTDLWCNQEEFAKRDVAVVALVPCSPETVKSWLKDIQVASGVSSEITSFPILCVDKPQLEVCFGSKNTAEDFLPNGMFVVGNDKLMKLSSIYPHFIGRRVAEVLRSVLALIVTCQRRVVTPVDWSFSSPCIVVPGLTDAEMRDEFPEGVDRRPMPSGLNYMVFTKSLDES